MRREDLIIKKDVFQKIRVLAMHFVCLSDIFRIYEIERKDELELERFQVSSVFWQMIIFFSDSDILLPND